VGDTVHVFDVNGKRMGMPSGGWIGEAVKAGPKLLYVICDGQPKPQAFRRDRSSANDAYGHQYLRTPEQVADEAMRGRVIVEIENAGSGS
jgi:hypothetical protein